nr:transposase [Bradyrhizobium nanningense]
MPSFHAVFTLPAPAREIAFRASIEAFRCSPMFGGGRTTKKQVPRQGGGLCHPVRCAAETLTAIAACPTHLGAPLSVTTLLHNLGQTLQLHPHVHRYRAWWWTIARRHTLGRLPARLLPAGPHPLSLFRRLFLQEPQAAVAAGHLGFFGYLAYLAAFTQGLDQLRRINWVVYAKPPFGGRTGAGYLCGYARRRCHQQADLTRRWQGELFLEGLSAESQSQGDDTSCR